MNIKSKKLSLFILTIFTIMSLSCNGCMSFFGSTSSKKPTIPESISKGSGKEPELTVYIKDDEWTVVTADNSPSAHFEHTVLVTKSGIKILTKRWYDG